MVALAGLLNYAQSLDISEWLVALLLFFSSLGPLSAVEEGFNSLFDGKTLKGWTLVGKQGQVTR